MQNYVEDNDTIMGLGLRWLYDVYKAIGDLVKKTNKKMECKLLKLLMRDWLILS